MVDNFNKIPGFEEGNVSNVGAIIRNSLKNMPYKLDIRIQQRKANKFITLIQGIPPEFDYKKILRAFKKVSSI